MCMYADVYMCMLVYVHTAHSFSVHVYMHVYTNVDIHYSQLYVQSPVCFSVSSVHCPQITPSSYLPHLGTSRVVLNLSEST